MSEENEVVIKALNMYGRVPEQYELLNEIERLTKRLEESQLAFLQLDKENNKLNNIINKLEKWLVEWREMLDCPDFYEEGIIDCINDTLNKIQELKGSDKE